MQSILETRFQIKKILEYILKTRKIYLLRKNFLIPSARRFGLNEGTSKNKDNFLITRKSFLAKQKYFLFQDGYCYSESIS